MLETIKKNWFAVIIALFLVVVTGFYINDQSKNTVKSKKVDGKQVVFSIGKDNYFADDFQVKLDESLGDSALYQVFRRELLTNIETSKDISTDAKLRAEQTITYIKQSEGAKGLEIMERDLIALGYEGIDSLATYYENELKYQDLITESFVAQYDAVFKEDFEKNKPRLVSHILVNMEDPKNPTEAELEKVKKIEDELEKGTSFADVANLYSDDKQSAEAGGSIGVVDAEASLVTPFLDAMLLLDKNETSEWIETEYGRHLILVEENEFEKLLRNSEYFKLLEEEHFEIVSETLMKATESIDFVFANEAVENRIKKVLGLTQEDED